VTHQQTAFFALGVIVGSTYVPGYFWASVAAKVVIGLIGIVIINRMFEEGS